MEDKIVNLGCDRFNFLSVYYHFKKIRVFDNRFKITFKNMCSQNKLI